MGASTPSSIVLSIARYVSPCMGVALFAFLCIAVLIKIPCVGESVLLRLPIVGPETHLFLLSDLSRSMAAFLYQGDDVLAAAEWSRASTRSRWVRTKLNQFIDGIRAGQNWAEAWCSLRLGQPLHNWLILNSARRQNPASGFEMLRRWLQDDIDRRTQRIKDWVDPIFTLILGAVVAGIGYFMFSGLARIIDSLAE